ncbi:MAG: 50S ribosomal protein L5 [Candidatus Levybacteria bacterium]|nr:50S ribosomal protein L5 [Candidatus Levybacteria bacterium]
MPKSDIKNKTLLLQEKLGIKNPMAVPRLSKIVVNIGVKDAVSDKKNMEKVLSILPEITGQKPKVARAKKSIAGFKLREKDAIGAVVTLRGKRMYDFFVKLVNIVLPRLRDFHGVGRGHFDGHGNYTLGFTEHTVFPEIDLGKVDKVFGLEVVIVTTAKNDKEGLILLEMLGMPFQKGQDGKKI